jgi:hypothetical protein
VEFCTCGEADVVDVIGWWAVVARTGRDATTVRNSFTFGTVRGMSSRNPARSGDDAVADPAPTTLDPAEVVAWWVNQATHGCDSGRGASED